MKKRPDRIAIDRHGYYYTDPRDIDDSGQFAWYVPEADRDRLRNAVAEFLWHCDDEGRYLGNGASLKRLRATFAALNERSETEKSPCHCAACDDDAPPGRAAIVGHPLNKRIGESG